jgi:hypothetical protein
MRTLVLGKRADGRGNLTLPIEPTEKMAIVGVSGAGKSYLAYRMCEEWMIAGVKIAIIDPVGLGWGLRTGSDGNPSGGMPVKVFGGQRGDAQLQQPDVAARELLSGTWSCAYDLSAVNFETLHWWVATFMNTMGLLGSTITTPLHIILEEAPMLAPQAGSLSRYQRDCKAAIGQAARVYRNFGLGFTVLAQRASALDKNILTQCPTLVAMRVAAKLDRRALMDWGAANSPNMDVMKALNDLSISPVGRGIIWSPTWGELDGVVFDGARRSTYHPDAKSLNRDVQVSSFPSYQGPRVHGFQHERRNPSDFSGFLAWVCCSWDLPTGKWDGPYNQERERGFRFFGFEFRWKYYAGSSTGAEGHRSIARTTS